MPGHYKNHLNTSHLIQLYCSECNRSFNPDQIQTYCPKCNSPLLCEYNLESIKNTVDRDSIRHRKKGIWRWSELLPVCNPKYRIFLGEGDTPLIPLKRSGNYFGLTRLYLKDEGLNPTGSFKARGLAVAVSKAKELGINKLIIPTAGNAGGAMAAYAAHADMQACVYMPIDTPAVNVQECVSMGAEVNFVDGTISDAALKVVERAKIENWFDVSTFKEPYRVEGKKSIGLEIAESFKWKLPDTIIYPTGGGTGLIAMWKAFKELAALGWIEDRKMPRMIVVQAEGCAPVVKAFSAGEKKCQFWENAETLASGLRVPKSFADRLILSTISESNGLALAVSDKEIIDAQRTLGYQEGILASPEGAATFAALFRLKKLGKINSDENIVIYNTASGMKYL